jgi:hypothetical protein
MLSDDAFRERLEQTAARLDAWAERMRPHAHCTITRGSGYWNLCAKPFLPRACPFDLILKSDQTFSLKLDSEICENKPIDRFELFPQLVSAIEEGRVEKIETFNALTDSLVAVEMQAELAPGFDWIGCRRVVSFTPTSLSAAEQRRTYPYLAYAREV